MLRYLDIDILNKLNQSYRYLHSITSIYVKPWVSRVDATDSDLPDFSTPTYLTVHGGSCEYAGCRVAPSTDYQLLQPIARN